MVYNPEICVRHWRKIIFPLKLGVYGPTRGPEAQKMDWKWVQKHKIALVSIYEGTEALKPC